MSKILYTTLFLLITFIIISFISCSQSKVVNNDDTYVKFINNCQNNYRNNLLNYYPSHHVGGGNIPDVGDHTVLSKNDKTQLLNAMKMVHEVFEKEQIPYIIAFGSLLGAIRHKGLIPWDDDMDLLIMKDDIPRVEKALLKIGKHYNISKSWKLFKIHPTDNTYIDFFPIDIDKHGKVKRCRIDSYNDGNKDCDEVQMSWWTSWFGFNKDLIFPLKLYQFEDTSFYGPNDGLTLIKGWYGDDCLTVCKTRFYNNSYNWSTPRIIPCEELIQKFQNN